MIQIAICVDDMTTTSQIEGEDILGRLRTKQHIQVQSRIFFDGKSFMQRCWGKESIWSDLFRCWNSPLMKGLGCLQRN